MNETSGTEGLGTGAADNEVDAWRDPYSRRGPRYYEDEHGNSASRPILLSERIAESRAELAAADADPKPGPPSLVSGLRLIVASGLLEEFASRLESIPENEPLVQLAREIAEDLWEASFRLDIER